MSHFLFLFLFLFLFFVFVSFFVFVFVFVFFVFFFFRTHHQYHNHPSQSSNHGDNRRKKPLPRSSVRRPQGKKSKKTGEAKKPKQREATPAAHTSPKSPNGTPRTDRQTNAQPQTTAEPPSRPGAHASTRDSAEHPDYIATDRIEDNGKIRQPCPDWSIRTRVPKISVVLDSIRKSHPKSPGAKKEDPRQRKKIRWLGSDPERREPKEGKKEQGQPTKETKANQARDLKK